MGLRYYYRDNAGSIQELQAQVRRLTLSASASAEEGSVGTFELTVDDPDATFDIRGHRRFYIVEDAALGDPFAGTVWSGYTGDRDVERGVIRAGPSGRTWTLHLHDVNTLLDRRINVGNDCNRPAESDIARVRWILNTAEMGSVSDDETYIDQSDPVDMDAVDYRGQKVLDVIDDCAQQSGRNYFLFWHGGPDDFYLWYKHSASSNYTSNLRISNTLADVDSSTIFAPDHQTKLNRSPSRVYSGVYQQYDGGAVYVTKAITGENFAKRDTPGRAENVKTSSTATRRAERYLNDIDTELDTIATSIVVDGGRINGLMQGHRVLVKYSHLPGYSNEYKPMRVRDRTVHEIAPDVYELALNLTGPSLEQLSVPSNVGGVFDSTLRAWLYASSGPYGSGAPGTGPVYWDQNSTTHGLPWNKTAGPFEFTQTEIPFGAENRGITVTEAGVIQSIEYVASVIGVGEDDQLYTITWDLMLNDSAVASVTDQFQVVGAANLYGNYGPPVTTTNLAVEAGDEIWGRLTSSPVLYNFRSPLGIEPGHISINGGSFPP